MTDGMDQDRFYWWFYATEEGSRNSQNLVKAASNAIIKVEGSNNNSASSANTDKSISRSGSLSNLADSDLQAYEEVISVASKDYLDKKTAKAPVGSSPTKKKLQSFKDLASRDPQKWLPFPIRDNDALETAFQALQSNGENRQVASVSVLEDFLYEVDMRDYTIRPSYWKGTAYKVRRSFWFYQSPSDSNIYVPCDSVMEELFEISQNKVWKKWAISVSDKTATSTRPDKPVNVSIEEYPLGPPFESFGITFISGQKGVAYLELKSFANQIAKSILSMVNKQSSSVGGLKLLRGFDAFLQENMPNAPAQSIPGTGNTALPSPNLFTNASNSTNSAVDKNSGTVKGASMRKLGKSLDGTEITLEQFNKVFEKLLVSRRLGKSEAVAETEDYGAVVMSESEPHDFESNDDEKTVSYDHLLFVVHGIGQKVCPEPLSIVHTTNNFREQVKESLKRKTEKSSPPESASRTIDNSPRIMVLPILWRTELQLKRGLRFGISDDEEKERNLESFIGDITLPSVPAIRNLVSEVLLDVGFYASPPTARQIYKFLISELNRCYSIFKGKHPKFAGKISLVGHSLGSSLCLDILCHQNLRQHYMEEESKIAISPGTASVNDLGITRAYALDIGDLPKLSFSVEKLFTLGSPAGIMMLMRDLMLIGCENEKSLEARQEILVKRRKFLPGNQFAPAVIISCKEWFNLFNQNDPVAYRIEPLIDSKYSKIAPVSAIPQLSASLVPNMLKDFGTEVSGVLGRILPSQNGKPIINSNPSFNGCSSAIHDSVSDKDDIEMSNMKDGNINEESMVAGQPQPQPQLETDILFRFNGSGRIDYMFEDNFFSNSYLGSLGAHTTYLEDKKVIEFILDRLY